MWLFLVLVLPTSKRIVFLVPYRRRIVQSFLTSLFLPISDFFEFSNQDFLFIFFQLHLLRFLDFSRKSSFKNLVQLQKVILNLICQISSISFVFSNIDNDLMFGFTLLTLPSRFTTYSYSITFFQTDKLDYLFHLLEKKHQFSENSDQTLKKST